mgnify:CR=1 FL=1
MSKRLEDLDFKEVAERTRIEPEFFEALLAKDFKELSKFNVKGFFKILKREYDLDMDAFFAEYEAFFHKNEVKKEEKKESPKPQTPPPRNAESKIVTNVEQYGKESSTWWLWALIVLVAGAIIYLVWAYDLFKAFVKEADTNVSVSMQQDIQETQNGVSENNGSFELNAEFSADEEPKAEDNATNSAENLAAASKNEPASVADKGANEKIDEKPAEQKPTSQATQGLNALLNATPSNKKEAVFETSGKVWVGFIDLATRANSSVVTDENFSVDLSKDQLLLIGGTALTLVNETGETQSFPSGSSKRFLVKDGKIKAISDKEFRSYNGGKDW